MSATISDTTPDQNLRAALAATRSPFVAALIRAELGERLEARLARDEDGSDAYVRHLELLGYDDARAQEDYEARMGIPA